MLQTVADAQKFALKQSRGAEAICQTGLWRYSRHPNYLGEIVFQVGVMLAGVLAALSVRSPAALLLSALAPSTFIAIMLGATRRLEDRQLEAYGDRPEYRAYVKAVPRLFVGSATLTAWFARLRFYAGRDIEEARILSADTPAKGTVGAVVESTASALDEAFTDTSRDAIAERELTEEASEGIAGIVGATVAAAVSAAVLLLAGTAIFIGS